MEAAVERVLGKNERMWFEFLTEPNSNSRYSCFITRRRSQPDSSTSDVQ